MHSTFTSVAARVLARLAHYRPFQAWLQQLIMAYRTEQTSATTAPGFELPEVLPLKPAVSTAPPSGRRLNLLVPAVSVQHVFGGIATALQVFNDLRGHFDAARIILTDEVIPSPNPDAYYGAWPIVTLDQSSPDQDHLVAAGSRWEKSLAVHEHDYFMATAWWTAQNGFSILQWQRKQFPQASERRLLYLIQDFEPGFYPWSSRYVLAQATYAQPAETIALINSVWLADYLKQQGYHFSLSRVLHPRLHPGLMTRRQQVDFFDKERVLLVYGRPGTERNAFSLVVFTLKLWVQNYPGAHKWQILSAGEAFEPIDLGNGCQLRSVGKLDIETYADLLCRTAVGLSLMVSPHPSYPPLEMAAFGAQVVTNRFANKNLSVLSSFLHSVPAASHQALAHTLQALTEAFDALAPGQRKIAVADVDWSEEFFVAPYETLPNWSQEIAQALQQVSTA